MNKDFGAAIRIARKRRGITQEELGELAGTGINFVSQLERGKETLRLDKLIAVLTVLGLELALSRGKSGLTVSKELQSK